MDHISVCIASYNRPVLLQKLLDSLEDQATDDKFKYSIVVVDNDKNLTAQNVVLSIAQNAPISIQYYSEPIQNISLARNLLIKMSKGNLIAFIDDDEFAEKDWLLNLYGTMKKYNCQIVNGPVCPFFDPVIPIWIKRTKYFDPQEVKTGASSYKICATGNCLIDRVVFDKFPDPFNPKFGLTGGEDTDFFKRAKELNISFCWCNEAIAYEYIGPNRAQVQYIVRRSFSGGNSFIRLRVENKGLDVRVYNFLLSFFKLIIFFPLSPLFLLLGIVNPQYLVLFIVKIAGFVGQMSAIFNIKYFQYQSPV